MPAEMPTIVASAVVASTSRLREHHSNQRYVYTRDGFGPPNTSIAAMQILHLSVRSYFSSAVPRPLQVESSRRTTLD